MPWIILLASAVLEAVWATALGHSDGFRAPVPTIVFAIALTMSMLGLGWAMKHIPLGTAYAVWVGLGAGLTAGWAMLTGAESAEPLKIVFLLGIIGSVIALKLIKPPTSEATAEAEVP